MSAATIITDETLQLRLKAMHLPSFLEHYFELGERAAAEGWSHVRYLTELVTLEAHDRADRRMTRLLRDAKLPREKTPATLDLNRFAAPLRGQIRQLLRGEFLAGATNVCLIGRPGTGKSHVMAALGRALVEPGHPVLFIAVATLVERLLDAKRNLRLARELKRLDSFDCLALDDIGYVQHDRAEMEVLFALLAERYERKSVMITSNLVFSKWDQIFKDPMTTAAAIDRVVHHAVVLEFTGPSVRAEAAEQRAALARRDAPPSERP
ncbi:MAG: IS21-like element helper ATPase IstB [Gammaproteobacteria bacterium]